MVVQTNLTQVVYVTSTVVQVVPSNPQVVYVPTYLPSIYYYYPPPVYVGPPPAVTFAVGVTVGLIIANNCDWHSGELSGVMEQAVIQALVLGSGVTLPRSPAVSEGVRAGCGGLPRWWAACPDTSGGCGQ